MVVLLVAVQFTHIVDFVVMMPLGPKLMRAFHIDTTQFGILVSAYTFSAAISGLLASFLLDRFDRKRALLGLYLGFSISTLFCALSGAFMPLLIARIFAGSFGGILSALALAIIGDYIPFERRGKATGAVMSAFSLASVIGVPIGLWLAEASDWHAPFFLLAITSLPIMAGVWVLMPPLRLHLDTPKLLSPWNQVKAVGLARAPQQALAWMAIMMMAGFSVIPYISTYLVYNAGLPEDQLAWIYLVGGVLTFGAANLSGRLSDKFGSFRVFWIAALISIIPILIITQLGVSSMPIILLVTSFFMAFLSARLVPMINLVTNTVPPHQRGTFMSLTAAVQQMSAGLAALIAGKLVSELPNHNLAGFDTVGFFAIGSTLLAIPIGAHLKNLLNHQKLSESFVPPPPLQDTDQSANELHTIPESSK